MRTITVTHFLDQLEPIGFFESDFGFKSLFGFGLRSRLCFWVWDCIMVPQLEHCSERGKISFWGGAKIFGLVYFSLSFLLSSKKKEEAHCAKLVYFSPSSLLISNKKKSHHLETAARVRRVWVGMLDSLWGRRPL